jgi:hypothetical protein
MLVLIASAAINASTLPAATAQCTSVKNIDASRSHWEMHRSQRAKTADKEKICRVHAASFYESVTLRQPAAKCVDGGRTLGAPDFEINAFRGLPAKKCGG